MQGFIGVQTKEFVPMLVQKMGIARGEEKMNKISLLLAAGLMLALAFTLSCSSDESGGDPPNPNSKTISWVQEDTEYKLALTDLTSASGTYTYILSVGTSGYSTGTSQVNGDAYDLTPRESGGSTVTINVNSSTNQVTTSGSQPITLTTSTGSTSSFSIPETDAQGTVTDNTGGVGTNPFVGTWSGGILTVKSNLTWSYSNNGDNMSGSYAFIDYTAIIYTSAGQFFGYATVSGNTMYADTDDGSYTFNK
jgi:hypothetical protein